MSANRQKTARFITPAAVTGKASSWLDLLRLFLVAQVIAGHLAAIAYPSFPTLDLNVNADRFVAAFRLLGRFGGQAAYVFICMSGYFLVSRLLATGLNQPGSEPVGAFLRSRLIRIYPTLIAAVGLTLLLDLAGLHLFGAEQFYRSFSNYDTVAALNWRSGLGNLLSLQPEFAGAFGSNGPLWTLGYIVQFYVVGAVLARLMQADRRLAFGALAAILAVGLVFHPHWALLLCCWLGCAGMRWIIGISSARGAVALVIGTALFVLANLLPVGGAIIASGLSGALLIVAMTSRLGEGRLTTLPQPVRKLVDASYALYAFHFPIALLIFVAIAPHLDTASLAFRIVWPLLAVLPALALALVWQAALGRMLAKRPA